MSDSDHGKGPIFLALREVAALTDKAARKGHLLDRLDHVWKTATERVIQTKKGAVAAPDGNIQIKCLDLAAELVDAHGEDRARRQVDLSVFNGGKSAERKSAG